MADLFKTYIKLTTYNSIFLCYNYNMSSSFDCFEKEFPVLTKLGKLAERYCYTDPNSALYKIRKIGETITALIYEYDSIYI